MGLIELRRCSQLWSVGTRERRSAHDSGPVLGDVAVMLGDGVMPSLTWKLSGIRCSAVRDHDASGAEIDRRKLLGSVRAARAAAWAWCGTRSRWPKSITLKSTQRCGRRIRRRSCAAGNYIAVTTAARTAIDASRSGCCRSGPSGPPPWTRRRRPGRSRPDDVAARVARPARRRLSSAAGATASPADKYVGVLP